MEKIVLKNSISGLSSSSFRLDSKYKKKALQIFPEGFSLKL
jgi:hypothetical protein